MTVVYPHGFDISHLCMNSWLGARRHAAYTAAAAEWAVWPYGGGEQHDDRTLPLLLLAAHQAIGPLIRAVASPVAVFSRTRQICLGNGWPIKKRPQL